MFVHGASCGHFLSVDALCLDATRPVRDFTLPHRLAILREKAVPLRRGTALGYGCMSSWQMDESIASLAVFFMKLPRGIHPWRAHIVCMHTTVLLHSQRKTGADATLGCIEEVLCS
jgi:hypothetical protein